MCTVHDRARLQDRWTFSCKSISSWGVKFYPEISLSDAYSVKVSFFWNANFFFQQQFLISPIHTKFMQNHNFFASWKRWKTKNLNHQSPIWIERPSFLSLSFFPARIFLTFFFFNSSPNSFLTTVLLQQNSKQNVKNFLWKKWFFFWINFVFIGGNGNYCLLHKKNVLWDIRFKKVTFTFETLYVSKI